MSRSEQLVKKADAAMKRVAAFAKISEEIKKSSSEVPLVSVILSQKKEDIKLAYQYLEGVVSHLPNSKKETYATALAAMPKIIDISRIQHSDDKKHEAAQAMMDLCSEKFP